MSNNTNWWYVDILLLGLDDDLKTLQEIIDMCLSKANKDAIADEWDTLTGIPGSFAQENDISGWLGYVLIGAGLETVADIMYGRSELYDRAGITRLSDIYKVEGGYAADFIEQSQLDGNVPSLAWLYYLFSKYRLDIEVRYRAEAVGLNLFYTNSDKEFYYCKHFTRHDRYETEEYPLDKDQMLRLLDYLLDISYRPRLIESGYVSMTTLLDYVDDYNFEQQLEGEDYYITVIPYSIMEIEAP